MSEITKPILLDETGKQIKQALDNISLAIKKHNNYIYGIKRSLVSSSSSWIRTDDSIGLVANATHDGSLVRNDFDNLPLYNDIVSVNYDVANGVVAEIGDVNFAFDGTNGEVMTRIPAHYYRRWKDTDYEYIQISLDNFDNSTYIPTYYIGRYTTSSGAHSYSGVSSRVETNITNFRTQAQAKGSGWQQLDYHLFDLLNLYLVEYADYNIQNILGRGNTSSSAQITLGGCDTLGMKSGCLANDGLHAVIYRGVENIFGNVYQFVDGLNIKDNVAYISYTPSQYAVDTFSGSYQQVGYTNATANGYAKELGMDNNNQLCALPISIGGSATTYVSAYYYQNTGNKIALFGGRWNNGANAGFSWNLNADSSSAYSDLGARLLKI